MIKKKIPQIIDECNAKIAQANTILDFFAVKSKAVFLYTNQKPTDGEPFRL